MPLDPTGHFSDGEYLRAKARFEAEEHEEAEIRDAIDVLPNLSLTLYRFYQNLGPTQQKIYQLLCILSKDSETIAQQLGLERRVVEEFEKKVSSFHEDNASIIAKEWNTKAAEINSQLTEAQKGLKESLGKLYTRLNPQINN